MSDFAIRFYVGQKLLELFNLQLDIPVEVVSNEDLLRGRGDDRLILATVHTDEDILMNALLNEHKFKYVPTKLEINELAVRFLDEDRLQEILLHEVVHIGLMKLGYGKEARDGHPYFEQKLIEVGAFGNNTLRSQENCIQVYEAANEQQPTFSPVVGQKLCERLEKIKQVSTI